MKHFFKSFSKYDWCILALCYVVYLMLSFQSPFISSDDYVFHFHQGTNDTIQSVSDLITSNIYGYTHYNGRFLVHCIVQTLVIIPGGVYLFWALSGLAFVLLLMALTYICRRTNEQLNISPLLILLSLLLFLPLSATLCWGMVAMTVNYMWSAAIYTLFLAIYLHVTEDKIQYNTWQNVLLCLFAIVCGSWQESYCIGIAGALAIYHLIHIRELRGSKAWMVLGFGLGAAILVFAPGNYMRAGVEGDEFIGGGGLLYNTIQLLKHNIFVDVWLIVGAISIVIDYIKNKKFIFIRENWVFFASGTIALLFTLFTISKGMMQGIWQLTILGAWDAILVVRFAAAYMPKLVANRYCKYVCGVLLLLILCPTYYYRSIVKAEYDKFEQSIYAQPNDTIYDGAIQHVVADKIPQNDFMFEKICPMYFDFYDIKTIQNMTRAYTDGASSWGQYILPEREEDIIARCIPENALNEEQTLYIAPYGYYIIRYAKDSDISNMALQLVSSSRGLYGRISDAIRHRQYKQKEDASLSYMQFVSDDVYNYYIYRLNWWDYHKLNVKSVEIVEY